MDTSSRSIELRDASAEAGPLSDRAPGRVDEKGRRTAARPDAGAAAPHDPRAGAAADRLTELFRSLERELLAMLCYLVGNRDDAADALQESFVKCWQKRDTLADVDNLRGWIFRVAINTGRDLRATAWRRRRRGLPDLEASRLESSDAEPSADLERAEADRRLREAIAELRMEEREVFLLRENGLTYEEAADCLGVPVGTTKTRMRMALRSLRRILAEPGTEETGEATR